MTTEQSKTTSLSTRPFPLLGLLESYQQSVAELDRNVEDGGELLEPIRLMPLLILRFCCS